MHGLLREHRFLRCKNRSDVGFWSEAPEKMFYIYLQKVFETSYKLIEIIKKLHKTKNFEKCQDEKSL